mgnify:CR=1 FL=1
MDIEQALEILKSSKVDLGEEANDALDLMCDFVHDTLQREKREYAANAQEAIINVLESNFGEVNDDFTIINDEVLILNAIQKLGVDFNENEDLRIFDKDNLVLIMNFSKFNKHGIERSQADTGLIMYKAHTESAYATICEDALML